ncbi:MAG: type I pullulanase [Erysipelotrichaceae bacterium]|nr:type I pullulanase [Erysipelotrichaceae bacterium]
MLNSYVKFKLTELRKVKALVFTALPRPNDIKFTLFKEGEAPKALNIIKSSSMTSVSMFELELPEPYEFGKEQSIHLSHFTNKPIDLEDVPFFPEFDRMFNYDGDDLGATYSKNSTAFALWAPLASKVELELETSKDHFEIFIMSRTEKGVYRFTKEGDLLNARYLYRVTNSGVTLSSTDPYAKGTDVNSRYSAVVDVDAIKAMKTYPLKREIKNYVDSIIYEVGVRDFTEQGGDATDIVNRGKYLGFVEEGRKTKGGNPAGLDYLVKLGVTHVQLNPIIDFGSVDDVDMNLKYNWGYDPISMFCLEGSYSLHPEIPMERLVEFKTMVNELHKHDIRVIVDVVYNHIYEYVSSCYEKIVPSYFFRRRTEGFIANASGCGDDVASEKYMVSKMIKDSMKYFIEVFDIDGYRFDLMGLIDIDTLKGGFKKCKQVKEDIMMYGEGWNMGMELPYEKKGCSDNADKLPMFGFFNDSTRDIVKGPTFKSDINKKGYINGDINYAYGLKYAIFGSTVNINYEPRYKDANQSINYIECHDNNTLFDKLSYSNGDEDEETILRRVMLGNGLLMTLCGVPFYHMGQEIGLSKHGDDNTYNVLKVNRMDWKLIDARWKMVDFFRHAIQLRSDIGLYHEHRPSVLQDAIEFIDLDNGLFAYRCKKKELIRGHEEFVVIYNPNNKAITYELSDNYRIVFHEAGLHPYDGMTLKHLMIPPISMLVLVKWRKE